MPFVVLRLLACLFLVTVGFAVVTVNAQSQSGRVYEFLGLPATARTTALGGYAAPDLENDLGVALMYPSLMTHEMTNHLSLNFVDYFGDINYGTVAFARSFEKLGPLSGSVQYINYGRFIETDESGETFGEFTAGEYSFMLGWGRRLSDRLYIGSNLKSMHSFYEEYSSWGMAVDVSLSYLNPEQLFAAGIVARNIGVQIKKYRDGNKEPLPFDIVIGASHKLANAPIRLMAVAHNLQRFDLTYPDIAPSYNLSLQETGREETLGEKLGDIGDKVMRHMVFGLEFLPSQNFNFRVGYNYRRRQEMKVESRLSTVGLSWGFGFKISRFHLNYGRSNYHLAGAPNHISISTSLQELFHRPELISPD
jgi:hypothetical protein